jgi:hypothetical protein
MSRLMADQENRGGDGDPGDGEEESVMGVNLAEGYGTVNDETCSGGRSVWYVSFNWFVWFVLFIWLNQTNKKN